MRLEEICQLRLKDISTAGNYDVFKVVISEDTKLKNIQSERIIPIHENLKKLGFLDYCKYLRKLKYERVFYDLEKNRDGYGRNM